MGYVYLRGSFMSSCFLQYAKPSRIFILTAITVILLIWPSQVYAAISVDAATSANTGTGTSSNLTIPSFSVSGSNTMLILGVSIRGSSTVSSATYGTSSFTSIGSVANGSTVRVELWQLLNPPAGTANIVVSLSGAARFVAGVQSLSGVNQTDPTGTYNSATGNSTAPSVIVSSNTDELVVDVMGNQYNTPTPSADGGQTQRWTDATTNSRANRNVRGSSYTTLI